MSDEKYNQNLMVGAAVVAGILGTLSALARSNRRVQNWTEQAKDAANHVLEKGDAINKNMLLGGVAGGLIGAATALLLAPKAGMELIKDLAHPFSHQGEHSRSKSHKSTSSKSASKKKGSSSSAKHKSSSKAEGKSHKSSTKKKSSSRRRTATAALKKAAEAPEKAVSEVTGT